MPQCIIRIRPNTLISLWYSLLCGLLQVWLLFLGFERYRLYTEMQWPTGAFPGLWLSIYASLLGSCIPLLALFLAFGLLKLGNLASDSEKLGARRRRTIQMVKGGMGQQAARRRHSFDYRLCHCFRSLWTHCPPSAQSVHLLLAIVQLFAQQIMLAQLYRFGFINSGDFLNTEMDFLFHRARQLATNLPMGETRLQSFRITSEELAASPLAPNLLPILMHARLFGIPLEFVNLLIALIAFSAAYPSVFWRASRPFSSIFSLFLLVHSANIVFTYLGFSVLFRIQETNFYSPRPVGMGQHLWALRQFPLFHPIALVGTFWLCLALQQFAPIALYAFGYAKFVASQSRLRHSRRFPSALPEGCSPGGGDSFCDGLTPHVFAITLLLLVAAAKAPAFYALGMLYYKEDRVFLLCCVMADLLYMFIWVLLWCLLTLKCQWRFRVHYDVQELISLQDAHKIADGNIERHRTPAELKNALLLIHGENLFLTDDPIAKPVIMRQILRNCGASAQTEGVGESAPLWLRSAAGGCQSLPGTQSPQRRTLNRPNGAPASFLRTPELGRQFLGRQQQNQRESPPVPLAAPPYQRMASLPPLIDGGGLPMPTNSFGTLQAKPRMASANEYASFIGPRPTLLPHQNPQMPVANGGGTLSRSFNAAAVVNQQQIVQNLPASLFFPENYASIHRRCSKSSVGGGSAASTGFLGPASMGSPHLLRADRANSLAPSNGNERRKAEMMPMNGGMGKQQQFEAMSERDQQRLFDGLAVEKQQKGSRLTTLNGENGGEPSKRIDIQIQAQKENQRQGPIRNSFAAPLNGVWQQEMSSLIEGGSLNGTTPTGSITVGSSRVGSAASACSTSQATSFEQPIRPQNGFNGGMGAPFGQSADYGTLTREGELTLKGENQRTKIVEKKGQWNGVKLGTESEYATSVV